MCRTAGRRCPGNHQSRASVVRRIRRHLNAVDTAEAAGDAAAVDHYCNLYAVALTDLVAREQAHEPAASAPTWTVENTVDISDADLQQAYLNGDAATRAQIAEVFEWRDARDAERDADLAAAAQTWQGDPGTVDATWGSSGDWQGLGTRKSRQTIDQQCRADYDLHVETAYQMAEDECRGVMLNARGKANKVDPYTLFSGPVHVAKAYASEELQAWWGRNGRLTYAAYRSQFLNRYSDRNVTTRGDFSHVAA